MYNIDHTNTDKKFGFLKYMGTLTLVGLVFMGGYLANDYVKKYGVPAIDQASAQSTTTANTSADMSLYWKVYALLEEKHIKAKDKTSQEKVYGAIEGLTAAYGDPFTNFFPPKEAESFKTAVSGAFEGVGMEVGQKDKILTVIAPLKKSPAETAGIKADDRILQINATSTEAMSVESAIKLIRGPKGTPVTLKIFRPATQKTLDITIIRDKIDLPVIDTENGKTYFKIALYSFTQTSPEKFQEALAEFQKSGKKNLILDLRNNPGGYLEAAVFIASFFLEKDKNVVTENFVRQDLKKEHVSQGFATWPSDYKVVVLVNKGSASASEILSGALQDYGKAKIVGEKTFGKGSVQEYIELDGGTSIKITVAKWLTPNGNSISDHGVTPDIIIPFKENPKNPKADNQLQYAIGMFSNWSKYEAYKAASSTTLDLSATTTKK